MKLSLILVAIFVARTMCIAQELDVEKEPIQPKPAIQERFEKVIVALNKSPDLPQDNIEARREIKDLKESAVNKEEIVKQLVVYAAGPDEEQPLKALAILELLDLPPEIIIETLAPYLNDDDIKVRSFVRDWFQGHDEIDPGKDYREYVGKAKSVPLAFAQYLFEKSPNEAFLAFAGANPRDRLVKAMEAVRKRMDEKSPGWSEGLPQGNRVEGGGSSNDRAEQNELLFAEHTISDAIWLRKHEFDQRIPFVMERAIKQLSQLSENERWWVRLYVAETMRQNRDFRQTDVLEKLSRDDNELVSKAAKSALQ